jgi:hypothetical protein
MVEIAGQELDVKAIGFGILGTIVVLIVMKSVEVNIAFKAIGAVLGFVVGVIYTQYQINKG